MKKDGACAAIGRKRGKLEADSHPERLRIADKKMRQSEWKVEGEENSTLSRQFARVRQR